MDMFSYTFIIKGGVIMIPLILLSVVGWAISAERLKKFWRLPKDEEARAFAESVYQLVDKNQALQAEAECVKFPHPLGPVLKAGLAAKAYQREDIKTHLERAANNEINDLERHLGGLLTVVGVSPMLGFLGTIVGLIRSFMSWEQMGENITVSALAGGIYQAMITTAAGLAVAIPLYIIYQYIVSRIGRIGHILSDEAEELAIRLSRGSNTP